MRGGEVLGGYGYAARDEYALPRGELARAQTDGTRDVTSSARRERDGRAPPHQLGTSRIGTSCERRRGAPNGRPARASRAAARLSDFARAGLGGFLVSLASGRLSSANDGVDAARLERCRRSRSCPPPSVGLLRLHLPAVHQLQQRVVQRHHAEPLRRLHHRGNLERLALADEVRDRREWRAAPRARPRGRRRSSCRASAR